jgi:EmrB/QacA subfamily drug resistance transporter
VTSPQPRRWLILFVILAAECMDLLDSTIVNVAAPSIRASFGTSSTALQWIVGGYPLAIAVGLIAGGRLGDLYGRRRLFLIGAAGFTAASVLCGLAPSTGTLIAFRLLQGAFGALMLPQGLGILRQVFAPEEVVKAFGLFGPVMGSAALLGPIVGGGLIDLNLAGSGWRLVFLINLPLGIAAILGALRLVPESRSAHASRLDLTGTALVGLAAILLVYPLIQGRELGWPAWTYVSMAASVALFGVFAYQQRARDRAGKDPLVTPSVFGHRGYTGGLLVATVFFAGVIGSMLCLMLFLQIGEHFTAIHAGLTFIPFSLGTALGAGLSGGLLGPKFGRKVLQAGAVVSLGGWGLVISEVNGGGLISSWDLLPGLLIGGVGMGLSVAPLFDIILAAVADHEIGSASGVLNAVQQLASSVGVAVLGTIFFSAVTADGDFAHALQQALWAQLGLLVAMLVFSPLLPRFAREETAPAVTASIDVPMPALSTQGS